MSVMFTRIDPFSELLLQPVGFADDTEYNAYTAEVSAALAWVDDVDFPLVVADAMLSDFPIVAVSKGFVREAMYTKEDMLQRNCRKLLERVTGDDVYAISRSARSELRAFCQLSRFPGAVNSMGYVASEQPNVLGDSRVVTNHFTVFRVYVGSHPMLVGLQNFEGTDPEPLTLERMTSLTTKIMESEGLRMLFQTHIIEVRSEMPMEGESGRIGLYRGDKVPGSLLFFNSGYGVLRQEPHLLSHAKVVFTSVPVPPGPSGSRRISLRLDTIMPQSYWADKAGPPMGFTQKPPESASRLHFIGQVVGFSMLGPVVNKSTETLSGEADFMDHLDVFPMQAFPEPCEGDVITVELMSNGDLMRYHNGVLVETVKTPKPPLGDQDWYGVFEVSMNVARATLVKVDPYLAMAQLLDRTEGRVKEMVGIKEMKDVEEVFEKLLASVEHLSISIATTDEDYPLIAVSDGFYKLTGFQRQNILGRNCRFLNSKRMSREEHVGIRRAIHTASHYRAVLPNCRADGTEFSNLLDLRTLELGIDESGAPVRFLVGIQGEVSATRSPEQWHRELPSVSHALQCNLAEYLQEVLAKFLVGNNRGVITPHPVPIWVDNVPIASSSEPESGAKSGK